MVGGIHGASDILPRSFYQQPVLDHDAKAAYENFRFESSIGRSPQEVAHDPANIAAALYLPLLSFNDYQDFLINGRTWFEDPDSATRETNKEVEKKYREIMLSLLDGWHEALDKEQQVRKRQRTSPLQQLIDYEYKRLVQNDGMSSAEVSLRTGVLTSVMSKIGFDPNGDGVNSMKAASGAWNVMQPHVAPGMAEGLGMATAYYTEMASVQLAYMGPAVARALESGLGYLPAKVARANSYAVLLVREIFSPRYEAYMRGFIRSLGGEARTMSEEMMQQTLAKMRITMLTTALALIYKSETGGMTSIEIGDMLRHKMTVDHESLKGALITMVRTQLSLIPPKQRAMLIESILEYIDGNPSLGELTRPAEVFDGILGTSTMDHILHQAG